MPTSHNERSIPNLLENLVEQGQRVQSELRCTICFSIPKQPCLTTCNHLICKPCLNGWMKAEKGEKKCPVCKMTIEIRSCTEVDYLNAWTNKYRQFAKTFMKDVASYEHSFENPFLESQVAFTQKAAQPLDTRPPFDALDDYLALCESPVKKKPKKNDNEEPTVNRLNAQSSDLNELKPGNRRSSFSRKKISQRTSEKEERISRETQTSETTNTTINLRGLSAEGDAPITLQSIFSHVCGLEEALKKNIDELKLWIKENDNNEANIVKTECLQSVENLQRPIVSFCGICDFVEQDLCTEFCFAFHKELDFTRNLNCAQYLVVMGRKELVEHSLAYRTALTSGITVIDGKWVKHSLTERKLHDMMDYKFIKGKA